VRFLGQIKEEFESNDHLKEVYPDVLYQNPRVIGPDGKPSKWGLARGITVKRKGNPKEATVEAHGLLDGQPTSRHYDKLCFDDVVTQDYLSDEQIKKTTLRFEMADNLGTHLGVRKQVSRSITSTTPTCRCAIGGRSRPAFTRPRTTDDLTASPPCYRYRTGKGRNGPAVDHSRPIAVADAGWNGGADCRGLLRG
jgi:hypothetical protein